MLKMMELNNNLKLKRVMIREDLNVPMKNGRITNDARIRAALPTIQHALKQQSAVILLSHLGRPNEGEFDEKYSLRPVARRLEELLAQPVRFAEYGWLDRGLPSNSGQIVLCENVRFLEGEKENNAYLAKRLSELCDVFVMDAFASAHRAHASTQGAAKYAPLACGGPLLVREIEAITQVMKNPKRPLIAIVGGSKVSTKIGVLKSLIDVVDQLILGGGIANTFIAAQGYAIGQSLYEEDSIKTAKELLDYAAKQGVSIPLPTDVIVAKTCSEDAIAETKKIEDIADDDMILDIGPQTAQIYAKWIGQSGTILWNGPVGVFEIEQFSHGTQKIARAIASSTAFSLAGGGDTIAAIEKAGVQASISYISTGGGAFLEFIEGKELPGIAILNKHIVTR